MVHNTHARPPDQNYTLVHRILNTSVSSSRVRINFLSIDRFDCVVFKALIRRLVFNSTNYLVAAISLSQSISIQRYTFHRNEWKIACYLIEFKIVSASIFIHDIH